MSTLIVRYQFGESGAARSYDLMDFVKRTYGGGVSSLANETFLIETHDSTEGIFALLSHFFTYSDKLFVGKLEDFRSLHQLPVTRPAIHKIAV